MFGGVSRDEYDRVVKSNTELRLKLEKMRLENTLLKDQVRVVSALPPEESVLYVVIQSKLSATVGDIIKQPAVSSLSDEDIKNGIEKLLGLGLIESLEKNGKTHYSVKTPDKTGEWVHSKEDETIRSPIAKPSNLTRDPDDV